MSARSPAAHRRIAALALGALGLIVLTGAAVRLSGSGLGCPDWPKCYGRTLPPLDSHAIIEYGNRILSGLVGVVALAAGAAGWLRRPFRRDLALLGTLLPLGVMGQAVLGGATVRQDLRPGYVMAHFGLSMVILIAAVALYWRSRHGPGERPRSSDARLVWAVRGLAALGALTLFVGTAATAAGPHAGGKPGQHIHRLHFEGQGTLNYLIHRHGVLAALLGVGALGVWALARRRGADRELTRGLTALAVLVGVQGIVGGLQYELALPSEIVWVHVGLATAAWVAILWSVSAAGRPAPRRARSAHARPVRAREAVGA